ncbi:MAG TPA: diacylglycerol kinase family protein [Chloroflexota bacterium]|jgi:YegS/Rv2252/BmrU family lipid kinase|nr:diacylglycerol kinase family protein [Chloroflexota bacterium]
MTVIATVVHNPAAGHAASRERQFRDAIRVLEDGDWRVTVHPTTSQQHGSEIASAAIAEGTDVVIAAGGDGTINDVIQGLAHAQVALGVLPLGTVNVWAREAGYSSDAVECARQLVAGRKVKLDLGRAGDRFFLLMAGVGLDAEVTAALSTAQARKQKLGVLPYLVRTAKVIPRYKGGTIQIEMDGTTNSHEALMVLVANTRLYGGVSRPTPHAVANDGMLDVRVFHGTGPGQSVKHIIRFLMERQGRSSAGDVVRARRVVVTADPPLAVQVDGDPIGQTPVEIVVERHALLALVPETYDTSLISPTHE